MSYLISADELKIKIVGWLLSPAVLESLIDEFTSARQFERVVEDIAEEQVEAAVKELRRDSGNVVEVDDINGLDDFVVAEMDRYVETSDFGKNVVEIVEERLRAEKISGISGYIDGELDDTVVDKFLSTIDDSQIAALLAKLGIS